MKDFAGTLLCSFQEGKMKDFAGTLLIVLQLAPHNIAALPLDTEIDMPESCKGKNYCFDKPATYPQDKVDKLLNELNLSLLDGTELTGLREGEEDDCKKIRMDDPIHQIVDKDGRVRVVLQSEKKFQQIILVEKCLNPGPLRQNTENFMSGEIGNEIDPSMRYNVSCVERRIDYPFLVLSLDGSSVEIAMSKEGIPVCCSCKYEYYKRK